jgi:periplasmic protein TonB
VTIATLPSAFDASAFNPLTAAWPVRVRTAKSKGLDRKRIAAIAVVVCAHVLVLGSMLLPPLPSEPPAQMPADPGAIDLDPFVKPPPPPPPPPPVQIQRKIETRNHNSTPIRSAAPIVLEQKLATTDAPSEALGVQIEAPILSPPVVAPSPVSEALELVNAPPPRYPPAALKHGVEGTVHFKVRVGVDGLVKDIEIIKSSGSRALDRAAIQQIKRRWVFEPRLYDGIKVESTGIGQLSFSLR